MLEAVFLERLTGKLRVKRDTQTVERKVQEWIVMPAAPDGKHFESLLDTLSETSKERIPFFESLFTELINFRVENESIKLN